MPAESRDPVIMRDIDLHIVCPHHLTIGMGRGTLAYIPDAEWFGLGTLAKILEAATAKCTLQETATREAADLAFKLLSPRAAYVKLGFAILSQRPLGVITDHRGHRRSRFKDDERRVDEPSPRFR